LKHLFIGGLSWRELRVLLNGLPMESLTKTALLEQAGEQPEVVDEDSPHGPWSKVELLLAALIDLLNQLIHVQVSRAGVQHEPPLPLRRPGIQAAAAQPKPSAAAVTYLNEIRERNRGRHGADCGVGCRICRPVG